MLKTVGVERGGGLGTLGLGDVDVRPAQQRAVSQQDRNADGRRQVAHGRLPQAGLELLRQLLARQVWHRVQGVAKRLLPQLRLKEQLA